MKKTHTHSAYTVTYFVEDNFNVNIHKEIFVSYSIHKAPKEKKKRERSSLIQKLLFNLLIK